jgi:hypothetical protein
VNGVVVLDSGPIGFLTNPSNNPVPVAIRQWLTDLLAAGRRVILPEIADYEVRREFIRGSMTQSLILLDTLANQIEYLPLTTAMMPAPPNCGPRPATLAYRRPRTPPSTAT